MRLLPGSSRQFGPPRRFAVSTQDWLKAHPANGRFIPLSPEKRTRRKPALHADAPMAALLDRIPDGTTRACYVADLKNCRVWGLGYGCVIGSDDTLLADVSPSVENFGPEALSLGRHEARERLSVPPATRLAGRTLAIHSFGHDNFHHWLLDSLPSFGEAVAAGFDPASFDRVVLHNNRPRYLVESLRLLGLDPSKILVQSPETHFICDELVAPSYSEPGRLPERFDYTPEGLRFVRELFFSGNVASPVRSDRIVVSREKAKTRRVTDGEVFHATLGKAGFAKVCLEDYTVQQQAALFRQAKVVVMPTGGGIANMAFCEPGARVIELFDPAYLPTFSLTLTTTLGLDWVALVGVPTVEAGGHSDIGNNADIAISAARVLEHAA